MKENRWPTRTAVIRLCPVTPRNGEAQVHQNERGFMIKRPGRLDLNRLRPAWKET